MDRARFGESRFGYARFGVYIPKWDDLIKAVEAVGGTVSTNITRRALSLGDQDAVTGWYAKEWTETTIQMLILSRASTSLALAAGTYVRGEYTGLSVDPVVEGDEVKDSNNDYFEVKTTKPHKWGNSLIYWESDLTLLSMHGLTYSSVTPNVNDARANTKTYWDAYVDSARLHSHPFIVCYDSPDYPFQRVVKDKGIDIIYAVAEPNSTPEVSGDQIVRRYVEHVPTHILSLDTELNWMGEEELRRITRDYPEGSQRTLETRKPTNRKLGSLTMFDTQCDMTYRRGTT